MLIEFVLSVIFIFVLWTLYVNQRPKNYPPGPLSYPIFGHLIIFGNYIKRTKWGISRLFAEEFGTKYGKIFAVDFASNRAIVINDYKLIREAWSNIVCCGRPKMHAVRERTGGVPRGIMFQDGEEWTEQRRFALRNLRDFGFGKKSMEALVADEALELIEGFRKDAGKPILTQNRFNVAVLNALWTITTGNRFSHDDPQLKEIVASITRNLSLFTSSALAFYMPWLVKFAPNLSGWNRYKQELPYTYNFLKDYSQDRIKNYIGGSPQHFTDVFIDEIRSTTDNNSSFYGKRGEDTMIAVLQDLFVAGAETTSTTLTWFLLYMALNPEIQSKLHQEIDSILESKFPSLTDRPRLLYTEACIMECLRHSALVPMGIFHKATEDIKLGGYDIPKNTLMIANLYAAHYSKDVWENPSDFKPERFLSSDGKSLLKYEAFIPFSFGKRICLGENLAKDELFIFVTSIFQEFVVEIDPNSPKPTYDHVVSLIASPLPHTLIIKERVK